MVKLIDTVDKEIVKNSGYYRLFAMGHEAYDKNVVELLTRIPLMIQSGVIRSGDELENLLTFKSYHINDHQLIGKINGEKTIKKLYFNNSNIKKRLINVEKTTWFFNPNISSELFTKYGMKINKNHLEPDIIIIEKNNLFIVELKDGGNFDTKKSEGEGKQLKMLQELFNMISKDLNLNFKIHAELVLWNIDNLNKSSIKDKIAKSFVINGKNFSKKHNINFLKLNGDRKIYNKYNNEKMKIWFKEILNRMEKYDYIFNPIRHSSLPDINNNLIKVNRSKSVSINTNPLNYKHFQDHQDIITKEQKRQRKLEDKIKKEKEFLERWKKKREKIKNKTTKTFQKNQEKFLKLKLKYKL